MSKSREYQALELLGPGTTEREWQIRLLLAHAIADKVVSKYAGEEIPTEGGAALPAYVRRRQAEMKEELFGGIMFRVGLRTNGSGG